MSVHAVQSISFPAAGRSLSDLRAELTEASQGDARWKERLAAGEPANLLLLDPAHRAVVDPAGLASRSRNSPYAGRELPGRVVHTFLRGEPTVLDGKATR